MGVDKTGDGDVEAQLLEDGEKLFIKIHLVYDSSGDNIYDE